VKNNNIPIQKSELAEKWPAHLEKNPAEKKAFDTKVTSELYWHNDANVEGGGGKMGGLAVEKSNPKRFRKREK